MKGLWAAAAFFLAVVPAGAGGYGSAARGTTTAGFLQLAVGARAASMGEAYSAVADEASALYWNPAALTNIPRRSAAFMHASYLDSSYFDYGAYGQKLGDNGAVGAGIQYFSAGGITQTDASGNDAGQFSPYDLAVSLGYACKLAGFSVGLAGKFIQSRILATARTEAADAGLLSPGYFHDRLRLAFTMANLGGTMRFEQAAEELPLTFKVGGAYKIGDCWLGAVDVGFPRNDRPIFALGTEYNLLSGGYWRFAGRAGFNSQTMGSVDGFTGASFGVGVGFGGYRMDYGFIPFGGIGQAHRLSLTVDF